MNVVLFDSDVRSNLLPLTFLRPVAQVRVGILTIAEKWEKQLNTTVSYLSTELINKKFKLVESENNLVINGSICPTKELIEEIKALSPSQILVKDGVVLAMMLTKEELKSDLASLKKATVNSTAPFIAINNTWDIFQKNAEALEQDFDLITNGRKSQPLSETNRISGDRIFLEEGAKVEHAILNATNGSIYVGKNAEIMEGSMVRGGLAMGESSGLKLGTKIYGATTVGPHSKVGGEVNNSVIFGYSNKGHDGFLGNSVIAEWCNLGADTNTSNLKNNYGEVKVWNYNNKKMTPTGLQFCGLVMGDHSKSSINSMFNTGTVAGVFANVFGADFPPKFVPSFSWGGTNGFETFKMEKAFEVAQRMMERRKVNLTETDKNLIKAVFEETQEFRTEFN